MNGKAEHGSAGVCTGLSAEANSCHLEEFGCACSEKIIRAQLVECVHPLIEG